MPHHVTNRRRQYPNTEHPQTADSFFHEAANASVYVLGGVTFCVGSVFFLPQFKAWQWLGAWLFVIGSLLYLFVTIQDLIEVARYARQDQDPRSRNSLEMGNALLYSLGCVLFVVGSLAFVPAIKSEALGAWAFIIGSLVFMIGAAINVRLITRAGNLLMLQLFNGIAILFMLGSLLFVVASVPYLWDHLADRDKTLLYTYLASQFIIASVFFFIAGLMNFYRAYIAHQHYCAN
ncbi:YrhK family protein [Marinobacteraceae bacterium S3BR75-40.1]